MRAAALIGSFVLLAMSVPAPAGAQTQSVITGTVTDSTGAALPGVTVEAHSPALIEGARTSVTDGNGLYRIVDLRPGTYDVSFELTGFSRVLREGISLTANFTATINTQMQVGAIEQQVTVTGASPVVDVQATVRRDTITKEQVYALPTGRNYSSIAATLPAVALTALGGAGGPSARSIDVGGSNSMQQSGTSAYGSITQSFEIDGVKVDSSLINGLMNLYLNVEDFEQFSYSLAGGNAEQRSGGTQIQAIPRSGSNVFSGRAFAMGTNSNFADTNTTPEQLAAGLRIPVQLVRAFDFQFNIGGPIVRDKLWFYIGSRVWAHDTTVAMIHDGKDTAHKAGEPVVDRNLLQSYSGRLTWQPTKRDRITGMYNRTPRWKEYFSIETLTFRPEAATTYIAPNSYIAQAKWTSTLSSHLLVEAGMASNQLIMQSEPQDGYRDPSQFPPYGDIQYFDAALNQYSNAVAETWSTTQLLRQDYVASASYQRGQHAFKVGTQITDGLWKPRFTIPADLIQVYNNGVPFAVDVIATCGIGCKHVAQSNYTEIGLYAQDTWMLKRFTFNPGIRWDRFNGSLPVQNNAAGRFIPARSFPAVDHLPLWKDVSARFGASVDVFGNGRLALKGNLGRYPMQQASLYPSRYNPMYCCQIFRAAVKDRRNWTDLNRDGIAEDNEIGVSNNPGFGFANTNNPAPDLNREYDMLYSLGGDYELLPNLGVSVTYIRRETKNLIWTDNITYSPSDYESFNIADPRGNGQTIPIYQVKPSSVGPLRQLDRNSDNQTTFNGVDIMVRARRGGTSFTLGSSTGQLLENRCTFENPNYVAYLTPGARFCDMGDYDVPFLTSFKASAVVPLPWYGFQVSSAFQSIPGAERVLTYLVTRAQLPQLTTASSVTVRLNEPGSLYLPRINNLDLSLRNTITIGNKRLTPAVEAFNIFNVSPETSMLDSYPIVGRPLVVLPARLVRFQVSYEW